MISHSESIVHLVTAAVISTAMFGFGLRGQAPSVSRGRRKRGARWPSLVGGLVGAGFAGFIAFYDDFHATDIGIGTPIIVAMILVGVVTAAFFMRLGMRGRRVGDHPFCRRCGFDLFGKPETSMVCNECGTDLASPRAVVVGVHQRRMIPLLGGVFVIILACAVAIPTGRDLWSWYQRKDFSSWKPESWLVADAVGTTPTLQAQQELWKRFSDGSLSSEGIARIIEHQLKLGAVASPRTWNSYTGDALQYVEAAWPQGKVDDALARRVLRASLDLSLDVAPRAAQGSVVRYCVRCANFGLITNDASSRTSKLTIGTPRVTINGILMPPNAITRASLFNHRANGQLEACGNSLAIQPLGDQLPLGPVEVEVRVLATITLATPDRSPLVEMRDLVLKGKTRIVTREQMNCPPITVPKLKPDGTLDINAPPVNATPGMDNTSFTEFLPRARLIRVNGDRRALQLLPPRLSAGSGAFFGELLIRTPDGVERPLGLVLIDSWRWVTEPLFVSLPDGPFDLIIRPTPERGCELFDPVRIYYSTTVIPSSAIER